MTTTLLRHVVAVASRLLVTLRMLHRLTTFTLSTYLLLGCGDPADDPPDGSVLPDGARIDGAADDAAVDDAALDAPMQDGAIADGALADGALADGALADGAPADGGTDTATDGGFGSSMSFFVSSTPVFDSVGSAATGDVAGDGNLIFTVPDTSPPVVLRGVAAADAHCAALAAAVGSPRGTWVAYLSTHGLADTSGARGPQIDARDRIGTGPWYDANGDVLLDGDGNTLMNATLNVPLSVWLGEGSDAEAPENRAAVAAYLAARLDEAQILTETGTPVDAGAHDIFTGSDGDGTVYDGGHGERWFESDRATPAGARVLWGTCNDWDWQRFGTPTTDEFAQVGHTDVPRRFSPSWNSAHDTRDCTVRGVESRNGAGHVYCFSPD